MSARAVLNVVYLDRLKALGSEKLTTALEGRKTEDELRETWGSTPQAAQGQAALMAALGR